MSNQFKMFSVVWSMNIDAPNAEEAAKHARELMLRPDNPATFFHVREDTNSRTLDDSELTDRGYECIDTETLQAPEDNTIQELLCARWNCSNLGIYGADEEVIPAFLLKHQPA